MKKLTMDYQVLKWLEKCMNLNLGSNYQLSAKYTIQMFEGWEFQEDVSMLTHYTGCCEEKQSVTGSTSMGRVLTVFCSLSRQVSGRSAITVGKDNIT
jgi:hypothetical protein